MTAGTAWRRVAGYFSSADPHVGIATMVALIVVGNQPFYPFMVWYAAGMAVPPAFLTWLSAPFFAASPALARRTPNGGRALLLGTAIGNTAISAWALGTATGVELFYLPCVAVAAAAFAPGQRGKPVIAALAATAAGLALVRAAGAPLAAVSAPQAHALLVMHAVSAGCLTAVLAGQGARVAWASRRITRTGS